jgi:hypothetical protein
MRALRSSPLFRIALLSLAVLFAHTAHAVARPIIPAAPACPRKVAAAQPDPEKKLSPASKRIVRPGRLANSHSLFGGAFGFTNPHTASLLSLHGAVQVATAPRTVCVVPQRRSFALRL